MHLVDANDDNDDSSNHIKITITLIINILHPMMMMMANNFEHIKRPSSRLVAPRDLSRSRDNRLANGRAG